MTEVGSQRSEAKWQRSDDRGEVVKNIHNEALNFYPIFIPLFECKVSGVSVQDMRLHLPFLKPYMKLRIVGTANRRISNRRMSKGGITLLSLF
jgi:hypothetical protein